MVKLRQLMCQELTGREALTIQVITVLPPCDYGGCGVMQQSCASAIGTWKCEAKKRERKNAVQTFSLLQF